MQATIDKPPGHNLAFTGGFTTEKRKAHGDGIRVYRADLQSGLWTITDHAAGLVNPSFLVRDHRRDVLYAVHGDCGYASAFAIDVNSGKISLLGEAPTGGLNGVHQALDPTGEFLIVANYGSGSLGVLPVRKDGSLEPFADLLSLPGELGPHRVEQALSHPHHVVFDPSGQFLLVPDKGLDRVFVLTFDPKQARLRLCDEGHAAMRPGAGPRHIVFHPGLPIAFVANELDSTVATCSWDDRTGTLKPVHVVSTLPADFFGASTASAIVVTPCGCHVFASNRGQDGIVHFKFDEARSSLYAVSWTPSGGRDPRFMTLDPSGRLLLAANEQSDSIFIFELDAATNDPKPQASPLLIASPTTIAFA
jgi:6-phosphogluconolactonase